MRQFRESTDARMFFDVRIFRGLLSNRVTESERKPLRAVKLRTNEYAYNYMMRAVCAFFASTPAVIVTLIRFNIVLFAALLEISIKLPLCRIVFDFATRPCLHFSPKHPRKCPSLLTDWQFRGTFDSFPSSNGAYNA